MGKCDPMDYPIGSCFCRWFFGGMGLTPIWQLLHQIHISPGRNEALQPEKSSSQEVTALQLNSRRVDKKALLEFQNSKLHLVPNF